jgi:ApaG protein
MKALFPYQATTEGVTVRVSVSYMAEQSDPARGRWFWAYHIRIENGGAQTVQLMRRHWTIADGRGDEHHVDGDGVVGDQPILGPGESYDYVSGCPLATPTGAMRGAYEMASADGGVLTVAIPRFPLLAPATAR